MIILPSQFPGLLKEQADVFVGPEAALSLILLQRPVEEQIAGEYAWVLGKA
jgi:hypothetical protein